MRDQRLLADWRQSAIPVLFRPGTGDHVLVKLPFSVENRNWLRKGRRSLPGWDVTMKCWILPRGAFNDLARRMLERFGNIFVIQPYKPSQSCCASCQNAKGVECDCSCMGKNHGKGYADAWFSFENAYAAEFDGRHYQVQNLKAL